MMASSTAEQGGYSYKFATTPPEVLFCHLCQLVSRDPQLSVCCGTNFCKQCVEKKTSEEGGCPSCNDTKPLIAFPNKMSDREIKKLIVLCCNNEEGCDWKDQLEKLEDHMTICEMQDVECALKCGTKLKRPVLDYHLNNECPLRQATCEYCHVTKEYHVIVGQHKDQCPKLPLSCPNDCGLADIIRSQMDEHLKKCPLQKTVCRYHNIGCKAMLASQEQDEHDEACMKEHFQLMSNELVFAKEELADAKLKVNRANQFTEQVRNELMDVKLKASNAEQSVEKLMDELSLTKEQLSTAKEKIGIAEQQTENMQKEFEAKLQKIQQDYYQWKQATCSVFSGILPSLNWQTKLMVSSILVEQSSIMAPVIVRVKNISEMIKNNETFQSPLFFTHCFGYIVCLFVTPNGLDDHKGTHVSVGISILSGPNDAKLSWPLRGQFTVTLLNQIRNNNHRVSTLTVASGTVNTEASYSTGGYVCKAFISHPDLFSTSSVRKYHMDDTIYIQVQYLGTK